MKRHLTTAGGGLLGIFLTVVLLESGASVIQGRQSATAPEFTLETPDLSEVPDLGGGMEMGETETDGETVPIDPAENSTADPEGKSVRDIAPEQFSLPEEVAAKPLERIEARQPLSDPVAKPEPVPSVLRHPVALSAGLIQFDGDRLLQLDGLVSQTAARTCDATGKSWPCGIVARTAFRNFLRARALLCDPEGRLARNADHHLHRQQHRSRRLARRKRLGGSSGWIAAREQGGSGEKIPSRLFRRRSPRFQRNACTA
ncbi:hypothetical protein [Pararhizobium sp. A13]|uniref:hypothetical protein n=1 Tax=Pararhizobium sp. A13 TaxID=3133975 RepID=UPI0032478EBE